MVVAYRIAADLGQSTELRSLRSHADFLFHEMKTGENHSHGPTGLDHVVAAHKAHSGSDKLIVQAITAVNTYNTARSPGFFDTIRANELFTPNGQGNIEIDGASYLWVSYNVPDAHTDLIVAQNSETLDAALQYVVTRLSVTAFATFWIAVWGAIMVSAIIVKHVKKHNETLAHMAMHDSLTGLPNRRLLSETVEDYIESGSTNSTVASLMVLDLDRFKDVNDTLGHSMGDALLYAFVSRLRDTLAENQLLARVGDDEFVIWCPGFSEDAALETARRVLSECRQPIDVNNTYLELDASIGIAQYPDHGDSVASLLSSADAAMYQAKKRRTDLKVFDVSDNLLSTRQIALSREIGKAIESGEFILHYQPKVSIRTGEINAVEALARWQHPTEGVVQPGEFIPLIEQSGRVNDFSRYVLNAAIGQCRQWLDVGVRLPIAVNISPYNLADPSLVDHIQKTLDKFQIPAQLLDIELTETASMLDISMTKNVFQKLKSIGVTTSIDDYGTGMSSLSYLGEFESDFIKIDRHFVMNLADDKQNEIIVRSTIDLVSRLGKQVVAEGIESEVIAGRLMEMGCQLGQGYYYSRPIPANELLQLVQAGSHRKCSLGRR